MGSLSWVPQLFRMTLATGLSVSIQDGWNPVDRWQNPHSQELEMLKRMSRTILSRLVSAGMLLTVLGLVEPDSVRAQQGYERGGPLARARKTSFKSQDIRQVLQEEQAPQEGQVPPDEETALPTPPGYPPGPPREQGEPLAGEKEEGKEDAPVAPNVDNAGMWLAVVIAESQGSCESGMREGW